MKIIKATTKQGINFIASAKHIDGYKLSDVYGKCSLAKMNAYKSCREICFSEGGRNFHITSHNTFGFSVAWETDEGIRIETPNNSYLIK